MGALGCVPSRTVPQVAPFADLTCLEVRLCDLERGIYLEGVRADNVGLAVVVPEWLGVVALKLEVDCVGP